MEIYKNTYWNLLTGELSEKMPTQFPSETWRYNEYKKVFVNLDNEVVLDISDLTNLNRAYKFRNGNCIIEYYNRQANKYYFNLINEHGKFLFEPVETCLGSRNIYMYSLGKDFVVLGNNWNDFASFDLNGKLIKSIEEKDFLWRRCRWFLFT